MLRDQYALQGSHEFERFFPKTSDSVLTDVLGENVQIQALQFFKTVTLTKVIKMQFSAGLSDGWMPQRRFLFVRQRKRRFRLLM